MPASFPGRSGQHPQRHEMFEQWAARFPNADDGLSSAIKTLLGGYQTFRQHHARYTADETSTQGARLVKSSKAARAILPLVEALDVANEAAMQRAAHLEAITAKAYNPPNPQYPTCMRHQEIRAHFKSLPNGDRLNLLEAARKAGDEDTLLAVASCQAYLSGVVPEMHQFVRDTLIEAHAPNEAAALKGLREQQGYAQQFRDTMLQSVADTVDFKKADELIAAARDDLAA
ncbi:MAG: hypothetical protein WDM86_18795 [Rhizomicrobium sp.]